MSEVKRYAERDAMALDDAGGYYFRHVLAMTGEKLHSKGDIAAELGWRDMQIEQLKAERDALAAKVAKLEWDGVFIPKDLDIALTIMGVSLPESKEEFNLSIERWIQRLVERVIRIGPELDAERNNMRAEGVEVFLASLNGATELWHPDAALEDFANQLRAGKGVE